MIPADVARAVEAGFLGSTGLHHVGLAVASIDDGLSLWTQAVGGQLAARAVLADQGVEAAAIALPQGGEIELIAPLDLAGNGGVAKFLRTRGAGIHHIALMVESAEQALDQARSSGIRLIDDAPRIGLHGVPIAFIHPASFGGVLVELVEFTAH